MKRSLSYLLLSSALLLASCGPGDSADSSLDQLQGLVQEGRYDEVVAELSPRAGQADEQALDARAWLLLAQARLGQDELPKAERALRDGLAAFPGDLELSVLLSRIYQSLGQVQRSLDVLQGAASAGAESFDYQLELGVVSGRLNDLAGARAAFDRARELGADEADVEFNLGVILAAGGDHAGAIGRFEQALAVEPERSYVKRELASSLFHEMPSDRDRAQQVAQMANEVLEADPEDWRAWSLLGETQLALGDPVAAQMYLTNALKFSHNEPSVEAKYITAAKAAKAQLQAEGFEDPQASQKRGGPPIPASVQERMKAAKREAREKAAAEAAGNGEG